MSIPLIVTDTKKDAKAVARLIKKSEPIAKSEFETEMGVDRSVILWLANPWPYATQLFGKTERLKVFDYDRPADINRELFDPLLIKNTPEITSEEDFPSLSGEEPPPPEEPPVARDEVRQPAADWEMKAPFKLLGHNNGTHFYLSKESGQVIEVRAANHMFKNHLITLAPLQFWEKNFPGSKGADWDAAGNALLRTSASVGIFDPENIRGRGVWYDNGRPVVHVGSHLIVDDRKVSVYDFHSRYIYPYGRALDGGLAGTPIDKYEANKFAKLCEMLTWRNPIYARLLAGWCVVAPICGGLRWRPHIWLTGSSGSGKSTVLRDIVSPVIGGDFAVFLQASTTEAGVRQSLGHDARPVIFDEIESNDPKAASRVQNIIELVRQSSTESGAKIAKGSSAGTAMYYTIRSCFMFSSINVAIKGFADHSRITLLQLEPDRSPDRDDKFRYLQRQMGGLLTPEYTAGFRARNILLIPTISHNAEMFARAGSLKLGSQRIGDQVGTLLAGAYTLYSEKKLTLDEAVDYMDASEWESVLDISHLSDEQGCLDRILEAVIEVAGANSSHKISVGEAIHIAINGPMNDDLSRDKTATELARYGIAARGGSLFIAAPHKAIEKMLGDTAWQTSYPQILERIPGAKKLSSPVHFVDNVRKRGVSIPISTVTGEGGLFDGESDEHDDE